MDERFHINPHVEMEPQGFKSLERLTLDTARAAQEFMIERYGDEDRQRIEDAKRAAAFMVGVFIEDMKRANVADFSLNLILYAVNQYAEKAYKLQPESVPVSAFVDAAPLVTAIIIDHWQNGVTASRQTIMDGRMYRKDETVVYNDEDLGDSEPFHISQRLN